MADWIIVVDDDETNLKMAGYILSNAQIRVTALKSGQALLHYLSENDVPDLILLDVKMPEMDGFETLTKLRGISKAKEVPVIFLTGDEKYETEEHGLTLGAVDFIKKPFAPEILTLRVRHIIELSHLQKSLEDEVEKKTRENERLFLHVVSALASAIDAKDTYTNGHSNRVANYAKQIATRAGYSGSRLEQLYMMSLLHDVGKIGIPDTVINKPAKLTEDEYDNVKNHTIWGAHILEKIKEMPALASGARWHHERYDGSGYPDGLKGEDIPEEARIIAVADSYDVMTSYRSYRDPMPQPEVRRELEQGMGTQFDPRFAQIMIDIIDEDKDYRLKEEKDYEG